MKKIRIGTRKSPLALWQANFVGEKLKSQGLDYELVPIETKGDKILDQSLHKIGSKGVFTEELEILLSQGEIDIAQHSAKDLTSDLPGNLPIIAIMEREIAQDVLVSFNTSLSLHSKEKIIVGTSSTRRQAMMREYFPQHHLVEMRGNLQTRMKKLENQEAEAIILAYAGVHRMGLENYICEFLPIDIFTPAVGQGAVAIQASNHLDQKLKEKIRKIINHEESEKCILAEREILKNIQGGCSIPFYGHCEKIAGEYLFRAGIIDSRNKLKIHSEKRGTDPMQMAWEISAELIHQGIKEIIQGIRSNQ